ncbi:MAG TPA: ferrous iron transport protein B, partial [Pyrinomonadaceae bacterium]|nr:ferrous iron transport protein B [Pyrinomonadaceae bacterium]
CGIPEIARRRRAYRLSMSAIAKTLNHCSPDPIKVDGSHSLTIALAGNPNAGKTSLFNSLTGLRQKVANYPGVTVESKSGLWSLSQELPPARVIDLPGLYSLEATSLDEEIARDILLGRATNIATPDVIVVAVDATNLVRNLYLASQLIDTGQRVVIALTMFDRAERSQLKIDSKKLGDALGVTVVPVVAKRRRGLEELSKAVLAAMSQPVSAIKSVELGKESNQASRHSKLIKRYAFIERVVSDAVETSDHGRTSFSERVDRVVTHRIFGPLILLLVMLLVFQTIFSWASLPMNLIDQVFSALADSARTHLPAGIFTDLLADGVIAGVGGVLAFLPQILLLFFFISILEDSGYMARAAFLTDRIMRAVGLHGKAFVPLLSSFACAVPGIMATRTIENPKDRIATIMIAPFMSCSARLPVYTLMIAAFFSGQKVFGVISVGALIILGMYFLGIAVAVVVACIMKRTILKAPAPPFVMELPPYRFPGVGNVAHALYSRSTVFLKRAGTVILAISILLWALVAFPRAGSTQPADASDAASVQVQNSFAGRAGRLIEPAIKPLGFDWKIGIGLISSFAARETIISTLSIVYNVGDNSDTKSSSLVDALRNAKRADGSLVWTPLTGLSLMIFFLLACQCMSTVAIVRRETNSWRWPTFMVAYMLALAYVASLVTYQGGHLLGFR